MGCIISPYVQLILMLITSIVETTGVQISGPSPGFSLCPGSDSEGARWAWARAGLDISNGCLFLQSKKKKKKKLPIQKN